MRKKCGALLSEHRMGCQYQHFVEMFLAFPDSLHDDVHKIATGAPWNYTHF
jgi:hypothetical protein